ncbi:MAG: EamA family transporter [Acetobacterales bacterium]
MNGWHVLAGVGVMAIWGINFPISKIGVAEFPPVFLIAMRFAIVAALLVPFLPRPRGSIRALATLSVTIGTLHFGLMFTALSLIEGSVAAIAVQTQVAFSALLAALFFGDRLGWRRALGMALAFGGVLLIAGDPRFVENPWPLLLVIGAAFAWAVGNIQIKRLGDVDFLVVNAWTTMFASPQLFAISLLLEDGQLDALGTAGWGGWGALAFQVCLASIVGYSTWYALLKRYDVNQVVPLTLLVPVFGVISSVMALGEKLTPMMLAGGATTIVGVAIIIWRRPGVPRPVS